jgi:hypothetical protein
MKTILISRGNILMRRISEATPACLMVMVQGNIAAITPEHWIKAFQTGILAGIGAVILSFAPINEWRDNKYTIAGTTGFVTAIADYLTHPTHFGGPTTEALVTGMAAGLLCIVFSGIGKKEI